MNLCKRSFPQPPLKGSKALTLASPTNIRSLSGRAKAFRELGADLALTYLNNKAKPQSSFGKAGTNSTGKKEPLRPVVTD